jgi:hypothetical protein
MHLPVFKAGLIGLSALFALVAAIAVFLYSSETQPAEAATYAPVSAVKFCNALPNDFPSSKPGNDADLLGPLPPPAGGCTEPGTIPASTASNITVEFTVAAGQSNFGSSVITNTPGTVSAVPVGHKVGGLRSDVTLGLLNSTCSSALVAEFVLFSSATTGAPFTVQAEGTADRWSNLVDDDASGGVAGDELANSDSTFVTSNLNIYESLFTPTGGSYIPPLARYTGATKVPSGTGDWQLLSFFQVSAGALDAFKNTAADTPHIFGRTSHAPTSGTLSLSILNDPTAVNISVSPIHDFCTPLIVKTMLLGTTPGGATRYTTPAAGTAGISNFSYGQRDDDNDGLENAFDTCPTIANAFTDGDSDGIDGNCDPSVGNTGLGDHDADGYFNRQDNCPLIANGGPNGTAVGDPNQLDSETGEDYDTAAPDGGPINDSIGDVCDPNVLTSNNEGAFVQAYNFVPKCIGGGDGDGDGYCAGQDVDDASAGTRGFASNAGMDQEFADIADPHGDGQGGNLEVYHGTDPLLRCDPTPSGLSDTWPFDLIASNSITIQDVLALKPVFGVSPFLIAHARYDFIPSKSITIQDVLALKPVFGKNCNP